MTAGLLAPIEAELPAAARMDIDAVRDEHGLPLSDAVTAALALALGEAERLCWSDLQRGALIMAYTLAGHAASDTPPESTSHPIG